MRVFGIWPHEAAYLVSIHPFISQYCFVAPTIGRRLCRMLCSDVAFCNIVDERHALIALLGTCGS